MRMITYCPKCGTEQLTDSRFCVVCGTATEQRMIEEPNVNGSDPGFMNVGQNTQSQSWQNEQSTWNQPQQNTWNQGQNQQNIWNQDQTAQNQKNSLDQMNQTTGFGGGKPDGRGNKNSIIMAACIVAVAIIAAVCIILIAGRSDNKSKSLSETQVSRTENQNKDDDKSKSEEDNSEDLTVTEKDEVKTTEETTETEKTETEYTAEELKSAAIEYCSFVYDFDNVTAKVKKDKNRKATIDISVTIDGHTGELGSMSINTESGRGTGCKGEKVNLFNYDSDNVDIHYIIPYSDSRMLSDSDLQGISRDDLTLARNEIYARHGRKFKDDDIREYFESQAWYIGLVSADQFDDSVLSSVEKSNISTIKSYEDYLDGYSEHDGYTADSGDYIIPDSSSRYLSYDDIRGMSDHTLMLARNEIYARHGRIFNDEEIRTYFESKSWYYPTISPSDFSESMLSDVEKANIAFIKSYED